MPKHRVIGGVIVTTPEGVFAHYRPHVSRIPAPVWELVRPVAIDACRAADYASVASALQCMSAVTYFLAWACVEGLSLDLEQVFVPAHVERYCTTVLKGLATESQSTRRGYLRRVGRACTRKAPWAPPPKPFANNHVIQPPYSPDEVEALWEAAESQATEHRVRVATAMLTLGLGAGVKPGEMLSVSADVVARHQQDARLVVILLEERAVPVLTRYLDRLLDLCERYPSGPLIGNGNPTAKDPLGALRQSVQWPDWLAFRPSRLRTTWMADVLAQDLRISEFMEIAGTVSSKSLEVIAPYVARRIEHDEYLFAAAGLKRGGNPMRWRTGPVDTPTFKRAHAIVRAARATQQSQQDMTAHRGRKRSYTYEALFTVLQISAIEGVGELLLSDAPQVAARLTPSQREMLGITHDWTYDLVEQAVAELGDAFKERVDLTTGEVLDPRLSFSLSEFMTSVASDLIPSQIAQSDTQAIDSTDYEAHARRRSWKHLMKADVPEDALPEPDAVEAKSPGNEQGWPRTGPDGRHQQTVDPDARDGYRAGKNMARKSVFCGWDLHLSVDVPDVGGEAPPGLIRGASMLPAGTYKAKGGLSLIDAMIAADRRPTLILVDRGYTYLDSAQWARQVWSRGIEQALDLHESQRGSRPGPIPGTVSIDGGLFKDTLPHDLRSLGGFALGMTAEAKALLAQRYDQRKHHAFTPMGSPNYERGAQRYRDPVLSGTMRYANHPRSLRLDPARYPTTQCVEGTPCACGTTVTLGPDDLLNLRQRVLYGTTKWKASYGRRSAVESTNACLKVHHARLARHSTRVRGTERNGILLSFILAAVNASLLLTRYGYDVGNPPKDADDGVIEPIPAARPTKALHRKFQRPRRAQAPPGPTHTPPRTTPWVTVKRTAKSPGKRSVTTK